MRMVMMLLFRFLGVLCVSACLAGDSSATQVLFVIGEYEYDTRVTLPKFAEQELVPLGFDCRFVHAVSNDRSKVECHNFPGLIAALGKADLLVLSTRRRFLKPVELEHLQRWIRAGKPVVAIRTSSHSFAARNPKDVPQGRLSWQKFDQEVLGAKYQGHYNNKTGEGKPNTLLWIDEKAQGHPLLEGAVWKGHRTVTSHLYKMKKLSDSASVLLQGQVQGQKSVEPVAWTYQRKPGWTFYTSLGSAEDLQDPAIRQLLVNAIRWSLGNVHQALPTLRQSENS